MRFATITTSALKAALAIGVVCAAAGSANANLLSDMHSKVRIGNKLCFATHAHRGQSGAWGSKPAAIHEAVRSWTSYTGFEYGRQWAHFKLAAGKAIKCSTGKGERGPTYSCVLSARPCSIMPRHGNPHGYRR